MEYRKIADHTPKGYLIDLFNLGFPDKPRKQDGGKISRFVSQHVPYGSNILRTFGQDPVYNRAVEFQQLPENVARQQKEIDEFRREFTPTEPLREREASLDTQQPLIKRFFNMIGETARDYYDRYTGEDRKIGYQQGGEIPQMIQRRGIEFDPPVSTTRIEPFTAPEPETDEPRVGQGLPLSSYLSELATVAPDIVNISTSTRLPSVPSPQTEAPVSLQRYSDDAIVADLARQFRGGTRGIGENIAQAGAASSATASTLASYLNERNKALDQNRRLNAQIGAQEAALNAQIGARNTERLNRYLEERQRRKLTGQQIRSGALASISEKIQAREAERNQMELDRVRLDLLGRRFEESGVVDRNLSDVLDRYESLDR